MDQPPHTHSPPHTITPPALSELAGAPPPHTHTHTAPTLFDLSHLPNDTHTRTHAHNSFNQPLTFPSHPPDTHTTHTLYIFFTHTHTRIHRHTCTHTQSMATDRRFIRLSIYIRGYKAKSADITLTTCPCAPRHPPSAIRHPAVCPCLRLSAHPSSAICHPPSPIRLRACAPGCSSLIRHPPSPIWHLVLII